MDTPTNLNDKKEFTSRTPTIVEEHGHDEEKKWGKDVENQVATVPVCPCSETDTQERIEVSSSKRFATVFLVCLAQFFDIFASSSTIIATPNIGDALYFHQSELSWTIAAYTLTFASFQLVGGRLSDIFHPKPVFIVGCAIVGIMSILCAVSTQAIMFIVFRAVQGIGAAFTVPSAVAITVQSVPEPQAQSQALAAFGAAGAVGNCLGFILGGVITSRIGWRWVFYLVAIMILPLCIPAFFILPNAKGGNKDRKLDIPGVGTLTAGLILFVYAISDGSNTGWAKPEIIVTLVLSVILLVAFFFVEKKVQDPAVPSRVWSIPNVIPLFFYALTIYWFLYVSELQLVEVFQQLFGWSPLSASLHCFPIGVAGGISSYLCGAYGPRLPRKLLLPTGQLLMAIAAILFALGDSPSKYWSYTFVAMIIGMLGTGIGYVGVMVAVMASAPKGEEGVISALLNTAFQLGATIGLAISAAVVSGINGKLPADASVASRFIGYQDGFWSLLVLHVLTASLSAFFVR